MDRRNRSGQEQRHSRALRCGQTWLVVATMAVAVTSSLTGGIAQASPAGAAVLPTPSLALGSYWCGHFDHVTSTGLQPHPICPVPSVTPVTLVTGAPNGPFSSGQYIDVVVGPNSFLKPGRRVYIKECAAPNGSLPQLPKQCDRRTVQQPQVLVGSGGTVSYQGYPILALPDATLLGERSRHTPICDLTHACILSINEDRSDFDQPHLWSLPFFVNPTVGDTGANPGNGLPEVPSVLALPVLATAIFGTTALVRRRRTSARAGRHLHSMHP
jgi:hypothetical protein